MSATSAHLEAGGRPRHSWPVAMVVHSYYEEDPRVRREAEALVAAGHPVTVLALRNPGTLPTERVSGVDVLRLDVKRHQGASPATYLAEYLVFLARATLVLARAHRHRRFGLVQVHSLPDFLVAAALPLRLVGVPVILDLHEAMPDFFRQRFPRASVPIAFRALLLQERMSLALADEIITVNDALADRLLARGVPADRMTVIRNLPSLAAFDADAHPRRDFMADGALRLIYTGALSPMYELDVAIRALAEIATRRPDLVATLDIYGRDFAEVSLPDLARGLGLGDRVRFHGRIPIESVPASLAAADIGIAPTRRNPFTEFSLSTKVFEYLAMEKPAVATRLPLVERTFPDGEILTYDPGDPIDLARAVLEIVSDPDGRSSRVARAKARVTEMSWEREATTYVALVDRTMARAGRARVRREDPA